MLPLPDAEALLGVFRDRGPELCKDVEDGVWLDAISCCGVFVANNIDTADMPSLGPFFANHIKTLHKHQTSAVQL